MKIESAAVEGIELSNGDKGSGKLGFSTMLGINI